MLTTLYRHHATALFRFALRLTGNRAAAEDLVADTFVVAVLSLLAGAVMWVLFARTARAVR
jgi:DNA-directed RNA polymerase specialized sigma24 family protein